MQPEKTNRFEMNRKAVYALLFSFIGLVLLVAVLLLVKAVRDEVHRGYERFIVMREHRLQSDLTKNPGATLLSLADGLENKPYRLRVDDNGFILPSRIHAKPAVSVVFLGGSTTECHFMGEEERFPYLVGRTMEADLGKTVNSYNSGKAGDNSLHCLFLLQGKVVPMHPKFAVLMECVNDLTFLMAGGSYWSRHSTRGILVDKEYNPIKTWIIRHLIGHDAGDSNSEDEFADARSAKENLDPGKVAATFRENLELYIFICRQHGITPVLMTQFNRLTEVLPPNLVRQLEPVEKGWGISYADYRTAYNALNETTRSVAREQGVLLVDLDRQVPKTAEYMYDLVHLNPKGSRLVADLVAKALEPLVR